MKLAHIITKLELGGAQLNTIYTVNYFVKKNYEVTLITGAGGIIDIKQIDSRVKIIIIDELQRKLSLINDIISFFKIYQICKKNKFDIVHTHSSKAGILGRFAAFLAGIPKIIHTVHGWGFTPLQNKYIYNLFVFLERRAARLTKKLIVVADDNRIKGLKYKIGEDSKYITIRSAIDFSLFKYLRENLSKNYRQTLRAQWKIQNDVIIIIMTACLKPQKNPLEFIRIAELLTKKNKSLKFIIVGDGELKEAVKTEISKLKLDDYFILTGWRNEIPDLLYMSDIFCLTSLWEGLPRSILEAYAAELPVVAADVDGVKEVVLHNKTGFLYKNFEISNAAEYLDQLIKNKELRTEFGKYGHAFIKTEFSIDKMLADIEKIY